MVEGGVGGWGKISALTRYCVPPSLFSLKVGHKKGGLTAGAVWYAVVCGETPDQIFCVREACLLKAHFVS